MLAVADTGARRPAAATSGSAGASVLEFAGATGGSGSHAVAIQGHFAYLGFAYQLTVIDIADPFWHPRLGSTPLPDFARRIVVGGSYAYVATGRGGLRIIDVADPHNLRYVGAVASAGSCEDVELAGEVGYLADGAGGLRTIDVADPLFPRPLGSMATKGQAMAIALSGDIGFVADDGGRVLSVDLSDLRQPRQIASLWTPMPAVDISVSGQFAYVALRETPSCWRCAQQSWVTVIGIASPERPVLMASVAGMLDTAQVAARGSTVYVAARELWVIDASAPAEPKAIAALPLDGDAGALALADDRAYVAMDAGGGLRTVDVSEPARAHEIATYDAGAGATDVAVQDNVAYVLEGGTLRILDVADPLHPVAAGAVDTLAPRRYLAVDGRWAVVAGADVQFIDVADRRAPRLCGSMDVEPTIRAITLAGGIAYASISDDGLLVVDGRDPWHPRELVRFALDGYAQDVTVSQGLALVAAGEGGLQILDVDRPSRTYLLSSLGLAGGASVLASNGAFAYVGSGGGIWVVDIRQPVRPVVVGSVHLGGWSWVSDLVVRGRYLYAATCGLVVLDVSDPLKPHQVGEGLVCYDSFAHLAVAGDAAYVTHGAGLFVHSVRDPTRPYLLATTDLEPEAWIADEVVLWRDAAFVGLDPPSNRPAPVVDVANPTHPTQASTIPAAVEGAEVVGDIAYVAGGSGFATYDVTDLKRPTYLGGLATAYTASDVAVAGGIAYVVGFTGGEECRLTAIDVTDPRSPVPVAQYGQYYECYGLAVAADVAYLAKDFMGIDIVDVSDPAQPRELSWLPDPAVMDVAIVGDTAFLAAYDRGLCTLDVSQPSDPRLLTCEATGGRAWGVAVARGRAYVADEQSGLWVFDVRDPTHPVALGSDWRVSARSVAVGTTYAYVAAQEAGLVIFALSDEVDPIRGRNPLYVPSVRR